MVKFIDKLFAAVPWVLAVVGALQSFQNDYVKSTHSFAYALVIWEVQRRTNA